MTAVSPEHYAEGVVAGDRRMLSKAITLIESSLLAHQPLSRRVMNQIVPHAGGSVRLGITGVPGVGKSTFIESFGMMLIERGKRVAVLAIDPSSTRSGGSIMADKTRMEKLSTQERAFIRPSPSGGTLGGVARKTRETLMLCEAAGYDVVIVETVGVGQSEVSVASMVDFFLVLMLAGAGDELQGIKKGILELADAIAITKADGDNVDKAARAAKAYENALHLLMPSSSTWQPPVLTCSAIDRKGIDRIWETVLSHRTALTDTSELEAKRRSQSMAWMISLVEEGLRERFFGHPRVRERLGAVKSDVERGRLSPTAAAEELLFLLDNLKAL
ncbi:MAG: methylmalonyl Co-A mutase-associated GTPase MeaB [Desulfobacterales bacterium]